MSPDERERALHQSYKSHSTVVHKHSYVAGPPPKPSSSGSTKHAMSRSTANLYVSQQLAARPTVNVQKIN